MARLTERIADAEKALCRLAEVLAIDEPGSIERDAAIQRFEFSFEATWKAARNFLLDHEGIDAASPKNVIRVCREIGLLTDDDAVLALQMADDRNLSVHTYNEPLAVKIYSRLPRYHTLLTELLTGMQKKLSKTDR